MRWHIRPNWRSADSSGGGPASSPGLTLREAAAELSISVPTLRRWIRTGQLSAHLRPGVHGQEYRIARDELERVRDRARSVSRRGPETDFRHRVNGLEIALDTVRQQIEELREELRIIRTALRQISDELAK